MKLSHRPSNRYDAVVVGARVAGASTAMLLARRGCRVLLVDRRRPDTDTLSTHALMRAGVLQLKRWGLLERVIESGAPAIDHTVVHYGDAAETVQLKSRAGVGELYAPRRYVLDSILARAAAEAGAEVRFQTPVLGLLRDAAGRVCGILGRDAEGEPFEARAPFTVGADGLNSLVARAVEAPVLRRGSGATGLIYGYWSGLPADRYDWFYRPGVVGGIIPTNGGEACVWAGAPAARFMASLRFDLERSFHRLIREAAPQAAERLRRGRRRGSLRGFRGVRGFFRQAWGPGWALVGDASHFKDPLSAHGITDALRDAEFLAEAVAAVLAGARSERDALSAYQRIRDRLTQRIHDSVDEVASFRWNLEQVRELLLELSKAMKDEVEALAALDEQPAASAA